MQNKYEYNNKQRFFQNPNVFSKTFVLSIESIIITNNNNNQLNENSIIIAYSFSSSIDENNIASLFSRILHQKKL